MTDEKDAGHDLGNAVENGSVREIVVERVQAAFVVARREARREGFAVGLITGTIAGVCVALLVVS